MSDRQENRKFITDVFKWFDYLSALLLFGVSIFICINVLLRVTMNRPIYGAYEVIIFITAVLVSFSLANCAYQEGHVRVTVLLDRLSPGKMKNITSVTDLLSLIVFILIDWYLFLYALRRFQTGETSVILGFPQYIVVSTILIGFILFTIFLLWKFVNGIRLRKK